MVCMAVSSKRYLLQGALWFAAYLALVIAPLLVLLLGKVPAGTSRLWDFAIGLGFAALSLMGAMFILTARFRLATAAAGIDIIYYFHRLVAVGALGLALAHPALLLVKEPLLLAYLSPGAPWHMIAGMGALLAMLALVASSLARKRLRLHYDFWRRLHVVLAVLAVSLAIAHVVGVDYYIHSPARHVLWTTLAMLWLLLLVRVRLVRPALMLRRPWRIVDVVPEAGDAWSVRVAPEGHAGLRFTPGQFVWLTAGSSPFAMHEHPFSIASSAGQHGSLTFLIKALGDFTASVGDWRPGQRVYLDGPFGAFSPDRHAAPGYVFIAGGIGIAPMLGMLRTLADRNDARPLVLFYAYRTREVLSAFDTIEALKSRLNLEVVYILSEPPPGWAGESGQLSADILQRHLPAESAGYEYFLCGPTAMTRLAERLLAERGVALRQRHTEIFNLV
jgi:predicted ferric reductase